LSLLAPGARRRRAQRGDAAILSYHNVSPDGVARTGDVSLHLPLRSFLEQIELLERTHRVVALAEVMEGADRRGERPLAAITFDDAYRGALTLALPALAARGLAATVFVAPGLLGAGAFWWDELAAPGGRGLDPAVRAHVLERQAGRATDVGKGATGLRPDQGPGDEQELRRAAALPGVTLASHTWSHPNLTALSSADLEGELARPRAWLQERFPTAARSDHLSFPYGLWDGRVAEAARAAGYRWLYRIEGGLAPLAQPNTLAWPRINVPAGVSPTGFELRTAGLVGGGGAR
jgi:peptidoglycan/xylan/chitin deacetylase (PgdA/CDA1 family)